MSDRSSKLPDPASRPEGASSAFSAEPVRPKVHTVDLQHRALLAAIVDSSDDAILSKTLDGYITSWNKGAERLYGYSPAEIVGKHVSALAPPESPDEIPGIMDRIRAGEQIDHYETVRVKKDGTRMYVSVTISPIKDEKGVIVGASAVARDVTDRRTIEELNRLQLKEKELLLQEVHHRVKNNLQVISSLLDLRSRSINDKTLQAVFSESVDRIRAMSLIHESLYKTEELSRIDFNRYLTNLTQQLFRTRESSQNITFAMTGDKYFLPVSTAVPLGLVMNELITNALKYAFVNIQVGNISIDVRLNDQTATIIFADDGVGMPKEIKFATAQSFGFRIVKLLIAQLEGSIESLEGRGTKYKILFPIKDPAEDRIR
jgi:two-component system, sensor histidine kinase PdtaS